jgi:hypothetical protein
MYHSRRQEEWERISERIDPDRKRADDQCRHHNASPSKSVRECSADQIEGEVRK